MCGLENCLLLTENSWDVLHVKFNSSLQIDGFLLVHIYSFIQRGPQISPDYDRHRLNNFLRQELSLLDARDQRWREDAATEMRSWQNSHGRPHQVHHPSQTPTTAAQRTRRARGSGFNRCSVWMRAAWWSCTVTRTTCSLVAGPSGCFKWYLIWSCVVVVFVLFYFFFRICLFFLSRSRASITMKISMRLWIDSI